MFWYNSVAGQGKMLMVLELCPRTHCVKLLQQPVTGSDRIAGARIQQRKRLPIKLSRSKVIM